MVNISGTGGANVIDVTNDNGTLDGVAVGTPVEEIIARGGNDAITNSTLTDTLLAGNNNDTVNVQSSTVTNIRLGNGNDTINFLSTNVRGNSDTDSLNLPDGTIVNDNTTGTFTVVAGTSYTLSTGTFTLPAGITVTYRGFENGTGFPCFAQDTQIMTPQGARHVQDLKVGDYVVTSGNGAQRIRWICTRQFERAELEQNSNRYPVRIVAGALGDGLPQRDLLVSKQHRMVISSAISQRMFGTTDVLVCANKLTSLPGVFVDDTVQGVEYFHLLFDQHEVIFAEGAQTESLYVGPEALKSLPCELPDELFDIFPGFACLDYMPEPALPLPSGKHQK